MTTLLRALTLAGLISLAGAPAAVAAAATECQSNDRYFVIAQEKADDVGTDFLVRAKTSPDAKPACEFTPAADDFAIGGPDEALWFEALEGNHLVLTRSTGPQGMLVVYDLANRTSVLDIDAEDVAVSATGIDYWTPASTATADNCAEFATNEANGLGSVIQVLSHFDFATNTASSGTETRCSATQ